MRARVAGYLQAQSYDEGTVVRKGQLLFLIDPKPFEATVARARADVAEARGAAQPGGDPGQPAAAAGGRTTR